MKEYFNYLRTISILFICIFINSNIVYSQDRPGKGGGGPDTHEEMQIEIIKRDVDILEELIRKQWVKCFEAKPPMDLFQTYLKLKELVETSKIVQLNQTEEKKCEHCMNKGLKGINCLLKKNEILKTVKKIHSNNYSKFVYVKTGAGEGISAVFFTHFLLINSKF